MCFWGGLEEEEEEEAAPDFSIPETEKASVQHVSISSPRMINLLEDPLRPKKSQTHSFPPSPSSDRHLKRTSDPTPSLRCPENDRYGIRQLVKLNLTSRPTTKWGAHKRKAKHSIVHIFGKLVNSHLWHSCHFAWAAEARLTVPKPSSSVDCIFLYYRSKFIILARFREGKEPHFWSPPPPPLLDISAGVRTVAADTFCQMRPFLGGRI